MKRMIASGAVLFVAAAAWGQGPLTLGEKIPLKVTGRIDHCAADEQNVYIAALGNNTVEVVDPARRKHVASVKGFQTPQGIAIGTRVYVANGGSGSIDVIDEKMQRKEFTTLPGGDADNLRYDAVRKTLLAGAGKALFLIPENEPAARTKIDLEGHPESFQFEHQGARVFVNVPAAGHVAVVDRKAGAVVAKWKLPTGGNYPLALDEAHGRLFVGCRKPAKLLVLDTKNGQVSGTHELGGDCDDLFYHHGKVYASCGAGVLEVFAQKNQHLTRIESLKTAPGARTCLLVPTWKQLLLAVPRHGKEEAGVWVYGLK